MRNPSIGNIINWLVRRPAPANAGALGERLASDFLKGKRGFRILARNWRSPRDKRDEIDIVAMDGEVLVFVEVKARSSDALVGGFHAVNRRKRKVLRRAIKSYVAGLRPKPLAVRFDVVEVDLDAGPGAAASRCDRDPPPVRHYSNIALFKPYFHF